MTATLRAAARFVTIVAAVLLVACGGSGSGEPPAPTPTPNRAPTITVSSTASVDENISGAVIASVQTSDADGDAVTVSVDDERFEVSGATSS